MFLAVFLDKNRRQLVFLLTSFAWLNDRRVLPSSVPYDELDQQPFKKARNKSTMNSFNKTTTSDLVIVSLVYN